MTDDPRLVDPDYDKHGGFPNFEAAQPGPGFARFLTAMRRAQDLAVSADPDSDTWEQAADRAEELVKLLDPFEAPEGVTFEVPQPTRIVVRGADKQLVGQVAADVRKSRPPEPYKGKGIRYADEHVQRKAGKSAK